MKLLEVLLNLGYVCLELFCAIGVLIILVVMTAGIAVVGTWTYIIANWLVIEIKDTLNR